LTKFAASVGRHLEGILAHWPYGPPHDFLEGLNNALNTGGGFRSFVALRTPLRLVGGKRRLLAVQSPAENVSDPQNRIFWKDQPALDFRRAVCKNLPPVKIRTQIKRELRRVKGQPPGQTDYNEEQICKQTGNIRADQVGGFFD